MKKKAKCLAEPVNNDPAPVTPSVVPASKSDLPDGVTVSRSADGKEKAIDLPFKSPGNVLKGLGGSDNHQFNAYLFREVLGCLRVQESPGDNDAQGRAVAAAAAALRAFKPEDAIEGMIAGQATALHFAGMECLRMAMIPEQPAEFAAKLRKDAANMMRSMAEMLEALDRKRGKGPQVMRVERVVVHEGGQAVVGNVHPVQGG